MKINKKVLVLLFLTIVISVGLFYIFFSRTNQKQVITTNKEPERSSTQPIRLSNSQELGDILLKEQYLVVKDELFAYVLSTYGKSIQNISVQGKVTIANDGNLTFTVKVVDVDKLFIVQVDRNDFQYILFSVPKTNYSKKINVFGEGE